MKETIKPQIEELIRKLYYHRLYMVTTLGINSIPVIQCEEIITDSEFIFDELK